jgi:hypothetical protein
MNRGDIVLMDTNVIIEAHRTKCWGAVENAFKVETVEKCCEEAATGDKRRADYVVITSPSPSPTIHSPIMTFDEIKRLVAPDNQNPGSMKFQVSVKEIQEVTLGAVAPLIIRPTGSGTAKP